MNVSTPSPIEYKNSSYPNGVFKLDASWYSLSKIPKKVIERRIPDNYIGSIKLVYEEANVRMNGSLIAIDNYIFPVVIDEQTNPHREIITSLFSNKTLILRKSYFHSYLQADKAHLLASLKNNPGNTWHFSLHDLTLLDKPDQCQNCPCANDLIVTGNFYCEECVS